jgi:hypothetical protein
LLLLGAGHLQPVGDAPDRYLSIYLNDHLAGSVAGVELARRAKAANEGTETGSVLAEVCSEIEADQETLREAMRRLQVSEDRLKPALGWMAEKLGRLKPNGQLRGYSPLSRIVELEGLLVGIAGKRMLWRSLERSCDSRLPGFDFGALEARAEAQQQRLAACHLKAVEIALGGD